MGGNYHWHVMRVFNNIFISMTSLGKVQHWHTVCSTTLLQLIVTATQLAHMSLVLFLSLFHMKIKIFHCLGWPGPRL